MRFAILTLTAGFLLTALPATAQTLEGFGLRAGATIGSLSITSPNYEDRLGIVAAGSVRFEVGPDIFTIVEAEYGMRGYTFVFRSGRPDEQSNRVRLDVLSLPILVRMAHPITRNRLDLFAQAGPRVDIILGRDLGDDIVLDDGTPINDEIGENIATGFGGGVSLGGGLRVYQLLGAGLELEARYTFGLNDITPDLGFQNVGIRAFDITVGINF